MVLKFQVVVLQMKIEGVRICVEKYFLLLKDFDSLTFKTSKLLQFLIVTFVKHQITFKMEVFLQTKRMGGGILY